MIEFQEIGKPSNLNTDQGPSAVPLRPNNAAPYTKFPPIEKKKNLQVSSKKCEKELFGP